MLVATATHCTFHFRPGFATLGLEAVHLFCPSLKQGNCTFTTVNQSRCTSPSLNQSFNHTRFLITPGLPYAIETFGWKLRTNIVKGTAPILSPLLPAIHLLH